MSVKSYPKRLLKNRNKKLKTYFPHKNLTVTKFNK